MFFQRKNRFSESKKILLLNKAISLLELLAIITIFYTIIKGGLYLTESRNFPIQTVKVVATYNHLDPNLVRDTVKTQLKNGFFNVNTFNLQQALLKLPWVYSVAILRQWPNTMSINITEQTPVGKWNENSLINKYGQIITPPTAKFTDNLPQFYGPDASAVEILNSYEKMQQTLSPLNLSINQIVLSPSLYWRLQLNNQIQLLLGYNDYQEKLQNFVAAYPKINLSNSDKKIASVDLRYKNGLSIKWQ